MKITRRWVTAAGGMSAIVLICLSIAFVYGVVIKIYSATTGSHREYLKLIGMAIARDLSERNAFPSDCYQTNFDRKTDNRFHGHVNIEQALSKYSRVNAKDMPRRYFDADIWTVIKNIPDEPPANLIVLATRNVDPSSLRTRLTDEDMQKHIRFKEKKDDLWILNEIAVFVYADGMAFGFKVEASSSRMPSRSKYKNVYFGRQFDITTNAFDALPVKYQTPDGEITPAND